MLLEEPQQAHSVSHVESQLATSLRRRLSSSSLKRPAIVRAVAKKQSPEENAGIQISKMFGKLEIASIDADGLFEQSALRVGDKILSVNGVTCAHRSETTVNQWIRDAVDYVDIVVQTRVVQAAEVVSCPESRVVVRLRKKKPDVKLGIGLTSHYGRIIITSIEPRGLVARTRLQVGDEFLSVNGLPCKDASFAAETLKKTAGQVVIEAQKFQKTRNIPVEERAAVRRTNDEFTTSIPLVHAVAIRDERRQKAKYDLCWF